MCLILDKDTIEMEIVPNIPIAQRGFPPRVPVAEIINAILYKLKDRGSMASIACRFSALFSGTSLGW